MIASETITIIHKVNISVCISTSYLSTFSHIITLLVPLSVTQSIAITSNEESEIDIINVKIVDATPRLHTRIPIRDMIKRIIIIHPMTFFSIVHHPWCQLC